METFNTIASNGVGSSQALLCYSWPYSRQRFLALRPAGSAGFRQTEACGDLQARKTVVSNKSQRQDPARKISSHSRCSAFAIDLLSQPTTVAKVLICLWPRQPYTTKQSVLSICTSMN